jgi:hypothetical protein
MIKHSRALRSVFFVAVGLLAVGCSTGGQQSGVDAPEGGTSLTESGLSAGGQATLECLRDRDWEIVDIDVDADGNESWTAPGVFGAQAEAYYADMAECTELNTTIRPLEDISQEEWEQAYAATVESAECLRGQGYDVPATPTFQAWKDSYFVDESGAGQWVPWGFVPGEMSQSAFEELEATCPQVGL